MTIPITAVHPILKNTIKQFPIIMIGIVVELGIVESLSCMVSILFASKLVIFPSSGDYFGKVVIYSIFLYRSIMSPVFM